jgi:hypothetical protein
MHDFDRLTTQALRDMAEDHDNPLCAEAADEVACRDRFNDRVRATRNQGSVYRDRLVAMLVT